jgi:competence protein ComEA
VIAFLNHNSLKIIPFFLNFFYFLIAMIEKLILFLNNTLGFTKRESRGFVLVLPLFLVLYLIPKGYDYFLYLQNEVDYQKYIVKADSLSSLVELPKVPDKIQRKKSAFVQDTTARQKPKDNSYKLNLKKIDFYEADSATLQVVPGIGPTLASRIVKYRENLGGIVQKEQLLEVYGLSYEVMDRMFEYFEFRPVLKNKIMINQVDVNELSKHPYVNKGLAKVIVAYRNQHGAYESKEDLLKIKIVEKEWLDKMTPYLNFDVN